MTGEPDSLEALVPRFLEWLADRAYSAETLYNRRLHLERFVAWCAERDVRSPVEVTRTVVELYQRHLAHARKEDGTGLTLQTQLNYLIHVRGFCKWLARTRLVLYDPAADLLLPRLSNRVPRSVFTPEEAERVVNVPNLSTALGLRDRAMLEMLYSTGMRRSELARLLAQDLDSDRGTALIREGKGRKDRMVPVGERAMLWTLRYLEEVRPDLVVPPDEGVVFLTRHGRPFVPNGVSELVTKAVKESGVDKPASAHAFRHTAATLMLEGGADIRFIQEMLGHGSLTTTEVYTRVSIRALKEVHDATHPAAKLRRRKAGQLPEDLAVGPRILLDDEEDGG